MLTRSLRLCVSLVLPYLSRPTLTLSSCLSKDRDQSLEQKAGLSSTHPHLFASRRPQLLLRVCVLLFTLPSKVTCFVATSLQQRAFVLLSLNANRASHLPSVCSHSALPQSATQHPPPTSAPQTVDTSPVAASVRQNVELEAVCTLSG